MNNEEIHEFAGKAKKIRKQLMIIFHVFKCIKKDAESGNAAQCEVKHCAKLKKMVLHLKICRNADCTEFNCKATRAILTHWNQCEGIDCLACGPLKDPLSITGQYPNDGEFMGNIIFNVDTAELCIVTKNGIQLADVFTNSVIKKDNEKGAEENGLNIADSWVKNIGKIEEFSKHMENILQKRGHAFNTVDDLFKALKTRVPKIVATTAAPFLAVAASPNSAVSQKYIQSFPTVIETIIQSAILAVAHNNRVDEPAASIVSSSRPDAIDAQSMQPKAANLKKSIKCRPSAIIGKSVMAIEADSSISMGIDGVDSGISIEKAELGKVLEAAERSTTFIDAADVGNELNESKPKEHDVENDGARKRRSGRIAANGSRVGLKRARDNDFTYLSSEKYQRRSVNDVLMGKRAKSDLNNTLSAYAETMACSNCNKVYRSKYHYNKHMKLHEKRCCQSNNLLKCLNS